MADQTVVLMVRMMDYLSAVCLVEQLGNLKVKMMDCLSASSLVEKTDELMDA